MKHFKIGCSAALVLFTTACAMAQTPPATPSSTGPTSRPVFVDERKISGTETIVFLRHAEKPSTDLGQLTPQGLNRAIALSTVLPAKFGNPDFLFAPDPAATRVSKGKLSYFYVRPLATIEPTAIRLGMPVQTPYGFSQIDLLNAELTNPRYAKATIFVAWEHGYEFKAVVNLLKQFGADATVVPAWHGADFDSLYVVKIIRMAGQPTTATFTLDHEGLDHQSTTMPSAAPAMHPTPNP